MKVSIITASYNSVETIENCIKSVINQSYKNIEYIIIDGKSIDGTLEIIEKHKFNICKIVSENDNGIYDAFNKGISLATGEIIGILNSDDYLINHNIIKEIVEAMRSQNCDLLYGNMEIFSRNSKDKIVRYWRGGKFSRKKLDYGWMPPHPTCYIKSKVYNEYGYYSNRYVISGDYEFLVRILKIKDLKIYYLDKSIIKMRHGGKSTQNIFNSFKKKFEDYKIIKIHKLKGKIFALIWKSISKIPQFFKKI